MINNWFLQRTLNDIDFYQPSHFYNDDMTMMFIYIYILICEPIFQSKKNLTETEQSNISTLEAILNMKHSLIIINTQITTSNQH